MMTLKKISHLTGFSVSTISKALNDKHDININTKKIIQEFATKSNYKPNKNAIALRHSRSNMLAVIVPRINDSVYSNLLFEMNSCMESKGYRMMLFQSFEDMTKLQDNIEEITDGSVDAVIVLTEDTSIENKMVFKNRNLIPIIFFEIQAQHSNFKMKETCLEFFEKLKRQYTT
jgi:LacI family transcriptional regulator